MTSYRIFISPTG